MSAQAANCRKARNIVTSGTASVDAVPDIATLARLRRTSREGMRRRAKKQADERVAQYLSLPEQKSDCEKTLARRICARSRDYDYQNGKKHSESDIAR